MNEYQGNQVFGELDWDGPIEKDSTFKVFPEGEYDFEIKGFDRARHTQTNGKLPSCNKAVLTLQLTDDKGDTTTLTDNLYLHTQMEGMLCAFFTSIGQRKPGEKISMNWGEVVGSKGRCKLKIRKWTGSDGVERESNEIARYLEPEEKQATAAPQQQKFQPGVF